MTDKIEISAVHLSTVGAHVIVAVEIGGKWCEVIRERKDNAFSHIVEAGNIDRAAQAAGCYKDPLAFSPQVARALRGELGAHDRSVAAAEIRATALLDKHHQIIGFGYVDADHVYRSIGLPNKPVWESTMPLAPLIGAVKTGT